ncbi:hypothetical protein [Escherichia coli]|uniref:hypothetical protein n=1 Tax=Escherichia coli TaxID=562 RepID=UPI00388F81BB
MLSAWRIILYRGDWRYQSAARASGTATGVGSIAVVSAITKPQTGVWQPAQLLEIAGVGDE